MIPISEFPYGDKRTEKNPVHERLLLLEVPAGVGRQFAIGYYDAVWDVFCICYSGFQQTEYGRYEERRITDSTFKHCQITRYKCIMPKEFTHSRGPRCIKGFMFLDEALILMRERNMFNEQIDEILKTPAFNIPYLLVMRYDCIIISDMGSFVGQEGAQFSACSPSNINGNIYHMKGVVPRNMIQYAVNLLEFAGGGSNG